MSHTSIKLNSVNKNIQTLLRTSKTIAQVLQIHAQLITHNFCNDPYITTQLLNLIISKHSNTVYADQVFARFPEPNTYMYNTMIRGFIMNSKPKWVFEYYVNMRKNGLCADNYTYPFVLKACGLVRGLFEGREVHGEIIKGGFEWDVFVRNGLIGLYCRVRKMEFCKMLFDGFSGKDLVSWNLMLHGYVKCGDMGNAEKVFDEMAERDVVSWSVMIDGYKKTGDVAHARVLFDSMPTRDLVSWNSIIDAYVKAGDMQSAHQLFNNMEERNVISWSIMIDGYLKHGNPKQSLNIFRQMLFQGVKPDKISIAGAVSACAQLGALDQGRWIHMYTTKNKITTDIVVQTALVDMYMKCGRVEEALSIFYNLKERNVVTWNVVITGLGMNGFGREALDCFTQMEMTGIPMDDLIFVSVLAACSHTGLIVEGLDIFNRMDTYGIEPKLEHYGCLIDLLGRAGQLDKALRIIDSMSMKQNAELWGSLLLACRTHHNVALAEVVVQRLKELKSDDCGVYVLMSNIYADVGMWDAVGRLRNIMREKNLKKKSGRSVIEVGSIIEEFTSGQKLHNQSEEIASVLWNLLKVDDFED